VLKGGICSSCAMTPSSVPCFMLGWSVGNLMLVESHNEMVTVPLNFGRWDCTQMHENVALSANALINFEVVWVPWKWSTFQSK
jgi:hypothetical protein